MDQAASRVGPVLDEAARRSGRAFAADNPQELLVENTRAVLCLLEAMDPPYGSVRLNVRWGLTQEWTEEVKALHAQGRFDQAADFIGPPDQLAAEFMSAVVRIEESAGDTESPATSPST